MQMNPRQERLWRRMIALIDEFRVAKVEFFSLVGELEGALEAGEFRDKDLVSKWYDLWTPLEILRADGDEVVYEQVAAELEAMRRFLLENLPGSFGSFIAAIEKARQFDAQDKPVEAAGAYEQAISHSDAVLNTFLDLAVLYFNCIDGGYLAYHHLSNDFVAMAWERMFAVLDEAEARFGKRGEIIFWRAYFRWFWFDEALEDERESELARLSGVLDPYFSLFLKSNGTAYREEAERLFEQVRDGTTVRKRYIRSLLESRRKGSEPAIKRPEEFYRGKS